MHFFVHIPKTAGTSFRKAAEAFFGRNRVAYDYGPQSRITSRLVKQHLYAQEAEDRPALYSDWGRADVALVSGHTPVARFVDLTGALGIITFLREPLKRSYSEYLHRRRNDRYKGRFRDFFRNQRPNHQSQMLSGLPFQALGFLGITERYEESLRLINQQFGWGLRTRKENTAGLIQSWFGKITEEEASEFYERNAQDLALFHQANGWLDQRLGVVEKGEPFAHAALEEVTESSIRGWAFWADGADRPLEIEVRSQGKKVAGAIADREHERMLSYGAPRSGRVGFEIASEDFTGDSLAVVVASTGQSITDPAASLQYDEIRTG